MKKVILAIDGGGSRTRCLAINHEAKVLGAGSGGASNHLLVDKKIVRASLDEAINAALARAEINLVDIVCVSAGLAGVDFDGVGADEMQDLFREIGFTNSVINGDMVIAHTGALAGQAGVLALAGTGSSILGVGADGKRVKVGGWGPIYGDEGSAYRIAQNCLRAAARSFDGRGKQTALLDLIVNELGLRNFSESVKPIYVEKMESREIAALCRTAYKVAESGDESAIKIFHQAGDELAESVGAAIRRLNLSEAKVSYQGSVLESCSIVRERFIECSKEAFPRVEIVPPRFKPVIGAFLLGCKAAGWSLDEANFRVHEKAEAVWFSKIT
jgi:N-acetylglucosamine kinase